MPTASQAGTGRTILHTSVDLEFAEHIRQAAEAAAPVKSNETLGRRI
jgi:hypothetical protein